MAYSPSSWSPFAPATLAADEPAPALDPFLEWARAQAPVERASPFLPDPTDSPVPDVAWSPPDYTFTEDEANPPDAADITIEPNGPPDYAFTEAEANPPRPIDPYADPVPLNPYPVRLGKPRISADGPEVADPVPPTQAELAARIRGAEWSPMPASPPPAPGAPALSPPIEPAKARGVLGRAFDTIGLVGTAQPTADERLVDSLADDQSAGNAAARVRGLSDMYAGDPMLLAQAEVDRSAALEAMQAKTLREQAEAEKKMLDDSVARREAARAKAAQDRAQIEQDARSMADSSPFDQYWSSRSTGQKVAGYIGAIFGGLMQSKTGGRNSAIDALMKAADDDAAAKWKALQVRREMNGENMADADADFRTKETLRLAGREQVVRALQAELASFDPEGSKAIDLGNAMAGVRSDMARASAAVEKEMFDRSDKMIARDQEQQRIELERAKAQADYQFKMMAERRRAAAAASGARSTGIFDDKSVHSAAEWAHVYPELKYLVDKLGPDAKLSGKDVKGHIEIQNRIGQGEIDKTRNVNVAQSTAQEKERFEDEREIVFNGEPLYQYDDKGNVITDGSGKPQRIKAQTPKEGEEIRKRVANSVRVIDILHQAKAIRKGASTEDLKAPWSDTRKRLDALAADAVVALKDGTEGMSSDSDMNRLAQRGGASALTGYFSQDGAIEQGIANLTDGLNTAMRQRFKYKGPPLVIKDPFAGGPPKRDEDVARLNARGSSPSFGLNRATWDPTWTPPGELNISGSDIEFRPKLADSNRGALNSIVASIERNDPEAPARATALVDAATSGPDKAIRNESAVALWTLVEAGSPAAVATFKGLDDGQRAAVVAHLPPALAREAFGRLLDERLKVGE